MNPGIATKQGYVLIEFLTGTGEELVRLGSKSLVSLNFHFVDLDTRGSFM